MAPSRSESQTELFPILDGEQSVGVFYFPKTSLAKSDQLNAINDTLDHLAVLSRVLEKHKINAAAAPKFSPVVKWLARFEYRLREENQKLLELRDPVSNSTEHSTEPAYAEKAL